MIKMPNFFENLLKGRTSTFNTLAVIMGLTYAFITTFTTIYMITHVSKFDTDTLRIIFDNGSQLKEIIFLVLGAFIQRRITDIQKDDAK